MAENEHRGLGVRRNPPESFIRWQAITREQLTFASNLIFALSVAALGYELDLLQQGAIAANCAGGLGFLAAISLTTSVLLGIGLVVNRLLDFRLTTAIARRRDNGATDPDLADDRELSKKRGARTWCLFWWQSGTFGVGAFLTAASVLVTAAYKVF